jgi:hypothetical protein
MESESTVETSYAAFSGARRVAQGPLREVLPVLKQRFDQDASELVLVFEAESGRQIDFDLRGSLEDVLERYAAVPARGPGRPKVGVSSREVSLLPKHWSWLEEHPIGISGALRRLVEQAMKSESGPERARRLRAGLSRFLSAMAGDRPNYEEACRALFAGETERFEGLIQRWPKDVREQALQQAHAAAQLDAH